MLITCQDNMKISRLKSKLKKELDMENLGPIKRMHSMETKRIKNRKLLFFSQQNYLQKVLKKFNMHDSKVVSVP